MLEHDCHCEQVHAQVAEVAARAGVNLDAFAINVNGSIEPSVLAVAARGDCDCGAADSVDKNFAGSVE